MLIIVQFGWGGGGRGGLPCYQKYLSINIADFFNFKRPFLRVGRMEPNGPGFNPLLFWICLFAFCIELVFLSQCLHVVFIIGSVGFHNTFNFCQVFGHV